ncbi:hypothetical protein GCM10027294_02550 [Marinactinospora endophytica]
MGRVDALGRRRGALVSTALLFVCGCGPIGVEGIAGREAKPPLSRLDPRPLGESSQGPSENAVLSEVNRARVRAGCPRLRVDERLRVVALGHSRDMAERGFLGHLAPDGRGPRERVRARGYRGPVGEVVAGGRSDATGVAGSWLRDGRDRALLLDCAMTETGVGMAGEGARTRWTQLLGGG